MSSRRTARKPEPPAQQAARLAAELASEKKGDDIVILDLRRFEIGCDYFVLVTGNSDPHVRAIADWIVEQMANRHGARPWHVEGLTYGRWVLLDYVDWVVHVFRADTRAYYMLEHLWGDAPRETLAPQQPVSAPDED